MGRTPVVRTLVVLVALAGLSSFAHSQMTCTLPGTCLPTWSSDPAVATQNIQDTIDTGVDTVLLVQPPGGAAWVIQPIEFTHDDQTLKFAAGVVVQNDPAYAWIPNPGQSAVDMFLLEGVSGIEILGNAADRAKIEFTQSGAPTLPVSGHCFQLFGAEDVTIKNLVITSHYGDGVAIEGLTDGGDPFAEPSQGIVVENCQIKDCARVGVAITNGVDVRVEDVEFLNIGVTTLPAGEVGWAIDIEPDHDYQFASDIEIVNCQSTNTEKTAFRVFLNKMSDDSDPVSIEFTDCDADDSGLNAYGVVAPPVPPPGTVTFLRCDANGAGWFGASSIGASIVYDLYVAFENCHFRNVGTTLPSPFEAPTYVATYDSLSLPPGPTTSVTFEDVIVVETVARPVMVLQLGTPYSYGLHHAVGGDISYRNPNATPISGVSFLQDTALLPALTVSYP